MSEVDDLSDQCRGRRRRTPTQGLLVVSSSEDTVTESQHDDTGQKRSHSGPTRTLESSASPGWSYLFAVSLGVTT